MHRVQVETGETFGSVALKVASLLKIEDPTTIAMGKEPNPSTAAAVAHLADKTIESAGLK